MGWHRCALLFATCLRTHAAVHVARSIDRYTHTHNQTSNLKRAAGMVRASMHVRVAWSGGEGAQAWDSESDSFFTHDSLPGLVSDNTADEEFDAKEIATSDSNSDSDGHRDRTSLICVHASGRGCRGCRGCRGQSGRRGCRGRRGGYGCRGDRVDVGYASDPAARFIVARSPGCGLFYSWFG